MIVLLRILLYSTILFVVFVFLVYHFSRFILGTNSVSRQIDKDKDKLHDILNEFIDGLVDLDAEELKLLSTVPITKNIVKGVSSITKGVIPTIYQEPIIAFAQKSYSKTGDMILVAKTRDDSFQLISQRDTFKVFKNDSCIGTLSRDYKFYELEGNSPSVFIEKEKGTTTAKVVKNDVSIAYMNMRNSNGQFESDRVFSLFHDFKPQMEDSLVILALFHILIKQK